MKTKKVVDLDDGSSFYFDITITARDYLNSPADVVHVFVEVLPVEDNNPAFDDDTMSATVSQNRFDFKTASKKAHLSPKQTIIIAKTGSSQHRNFPCDFSSKK